MLIFLFYFFAFRFILQSSDTHLNLVFNNTNNLIIMFNVVFIKSLNNYLFHGLFYNIVIIKFTYKMVD